MQKGGGNSSGSLGLGNSGAHSSNNSSNTNSHNKNSINSEHHHQNPLSQFNDFLKSTFNFSNSSNRNSSNSAGSPIAGSPLISPTSSGKNGQNCKSALSTMARSAATTNISPISIVNTLSNSTEQLQQSVDTLNAELSQQLTLENQRKNENNTNIPNCAKVVNAYAAITEDEITVQKGDLVQIITANMHNRFLVHREASEHQPAAEGWIPGFVIGFQSTNST